MIPTQFYYICRYILQLLHDKSFTKLLCDETKIFNEIFKIDNNM